MEMEYHDDTKRRKVFIVLGVVLAVVAGGAAFFLVNQAQTAGNAAVATRQVVVAARDLPVRTVIEASDVTVRSVPEDPSVATAYTTPEEVVGRITGAPILFQQAFTPNLLTSTTAGSGFSILGPEETIAPDSPVWRAVAVYVPDERAVAGQIQIGQRVDLLLTAGINVVPAAEGTGGSSGARDGSESTGTGAGVDRHGCRDAVRGPLLQRPVDQDQLPEHHHPGQDGAALHHQGRPQPGRGDQPPLGRRQCDLQHGPAPRGRRSDRRHDRVRRDDEPDHREVRAADPAGLPDPLGRALRPRAARSASSVAAMAASSDPSVRRMRVAAGANRSAISPWAAMRRSASLGVHAPEAEPLALRGSIADHQPDLVAARRQAALDELDRLDDHERRGLRLGRAEAGLDLQPDGGMDDRLEVAQRARIVEDDGGQGRPVELAPVAEDRVAEALADGRQGRPARAPSPGGPGRRHR